jgi:hypothetical protein
MLRTIATKTLEGLPLVPKPAYPSAVNDYAIAVGGSTAGRIMLRPKSGGEASWLWTLTGPALPTELAPGHGEATTLQEAKLAFRAKFRDWQVWASARDGEAYWHD